MRADRSYLASGFYTVGVNIQAIKNSVMLMDLRILGMTSMTTLVGIGAGNTGDVYRNVSNNKRGGHAVFTIGWSDSARISLQEQLGGNSWPQQ
ncbi:MAG: hypothetical protein R3B91_21925 [Planctomycetaceae bacterium]